MPRKKVDGNYTRMQRAVSKKILEAIPYKTTVVRLRLWLLISQTIIVHSIPAYLAHMRELSEQQKLAFINSMKTLNAVLRTCGEWCFIWADSERRREIVKRIHVVGIPLWWWRWWWWWIFCNAGALRNAEYPFITIAPRSTLARIGSTS